MLHADWILAGTMRHAFRAGHRVQTCFKDSGSSPHVLSLSACHFNITLCLAGTSTSRIWVSCVLAAYRYSRDKHLKPATGHVGTCGSQGATSDPKPTLHFSAKFPGGLRDSGLVSACHLRTRRRHIQGGTQQGAIHVSYSCTQAH